MIFSQFTESIILFTWGFVPWFIRCGWAYTFLSRVKAFKMNLFFLFNRQFTVLTLSIYTVILIALPPLSKADTIIETGVYTWFEKSETTESYNGLASDIKIYRKLKGHFYGGIIYERNDTELLQLNGYGAGLAYSNNSWLTSLHVLSIDSTNINLEWSFRLDCSYQLKINSKCFIGPRLSFRSYLGEANVNAFRPMFFSFFIL